LPESFLKRKCREGESIVNVVNSSPFSEVQKRQLCEIIETIDKRSTLLPSSAPKLQSGTASGKTLSHDTGRF
jgi:hypothetical protein